MHISSFHQCDSTTSVREFLTQVQLPSPTLIGVIGCGCSVATEPVADIISLYGLPLVSENNRTSSSLSSSCTSAINLVL